MFFGFFARRETKVAGAGPIPMDRVRPPKDTIPRRPARLPLPVAGAASPRVWAIAGAEKAVRATAEAKRPRSRRRMEYLT